MALVGAAVCPHPPLLVPDVASGATDETGPLRDACRRAVDAIVAADPDVVVVVGDAPTTGPLPSGTGGTFAGFGVARDVVLGRAAAAAPAGRLPLSLAVGAWLLEGASGPGVHQGYGVARGTTSTEAAAIGVDLAARADRVVLLVMGDGSARRTEKAPGALDERAAAFDASVSRALRDVDCDALLDLDAALAEELLVAGRASWQVLAGAAWGLPWRAAVTYDDAPYGVGYLVATWQRA